MIGIESCHPSSGFELCIYPQESRRQRADWILWISKDGSGQLYLGREETGGIKNDSIKLPANVSRKKKK